MQLPRFFIVLMVIIERVWLSEIMIRTDKSHGLIELEDAAIKLLSNCYANQDKTAVLIGDIPGSFIKKLSAQRNVSIVLLDNRRKANIHTNYWLGKNFNKGHKVHIVVTMAAHYKTLIELLFMFNKCRYRSSSPFVMMLGWTPENQYASCKGNSKTFLTLITAQLYNLPQAKLICRDIQRGIVIYESSVFIHNAPETWRLVHSHHSRNVDHRTSYFMREYREHEQMCENLFFKKVHDMDGMAITTIKLCPDRCWGIIKKDQSKNKYKRIENESRFGLIRNFINHMNATEKPEWQKLVLGKLMEAGSNGILISPIHIRGFPWNVSYAYPYGTDCKFIVTQFRGHKTQLQKIFDIIDTYSWAGMCMTYLISILCFKFFLQQPLIVAVLNLCRMTCSLGLVTSPSNVSSQIYIGCLLFFMITMQGIFTSGMASVLTLDVPARQADLIRDLANFGYTVYVDKGDFIHFTDQRFKGRLNLRLPNENCIQYIKRNASIACLTWSATDRVMALNDNLYVSNCIIREYISVSLPRFWEFQEQFDNFVRMTKGGGIMTDFDVLVDEKRLNEAEFEQGFSEPKIMTVNDLGFAFAILGVGLGCALVSFIVELTIYRFQRKVKTTRITVQSRRE